MAVKSPGRSAKLQGIEKELPTNSILGAQFGIFGTNETVIRHAEYIGSFLVTGKGHHDRAEIVRQKLESARAYTHSKPILLLISLQGIKVCRENNEHVYMAHALRRISYATCDPDNLQFAFLAREPKAQPNIQYCHAFVTNTADEAEELNNIVGEAFRVAYAQQRLAMLSEQMRNSAVSPSKSGTSSTAVPQPDKGTQPAQPAPRNQELTSSGSQPTELTNGSDFKATKSKHSSPSRRSDPNPNTCVLNKPLPPVPGDIQSPDGIPSGIPELQICDAVAETATTLVTSTTVAGTTTVTDSPREHKSHKHHKHHKHRHRHKTRDGAPSVNVDNGTSVSADSGRHTGTSESLTDGMPPCPKDTVACHRSTQPPPPPPRGSSSLTACLLEEQPALNGHAASSRPVVTNLSSNGAGLSARPLSETLLSLSDLPISSLPESPRAVRNTSQSSLTDRTKQPSLPSSRPQSQHSYDMADHRSCGGLVTPTSAVTDTPHSAAHTPSVSGHQMNTSAVTTASSSTTGCSTATSGSTHSGSGSGHSLPGQRRSGMGSTGTAGENRSTGSGGSYPVSSRHSLSRLPLPPEAAEAVHSGSNPTGSILGALDESAELSQAPWYQPHVPREVALEILSRQPPGSFVIRDSGSHANCYALSVRFGEGAGRCSVPGQVPGLTRLGMSHGCAGSASSPAYPFAGTGISHFLIQRTVRGGVRLKGLDKEWPSLACLVLHLTVMPEMLPCPLKLPKAASNPAFDAEERVDAADVNTPGPSCAHFRPILDAPLRCGDGVEAMNESGAHLGIQEDEDYQRLSDFSSIMADLQPRTRANRHASAQNRPGCRGR